MTLSEISPLNILVAYIGLLSIQVFIQGSLSCLNLLHIEKHSDTIPEFARSVYDSERYAKSIAYTREKGILGVLTMLYTTVFTLVFIVMGWFGSLEIWTHKLLPPGYLSAVSYIFALSLVFYVVELPSTLFDTFRIEAKFGFNTTSFRVWLIDQCKSFFVSVLLMAPLLAGVLWFMDVTGRHWWVYVFFFIAAFQIAVLFIYPVWIAPLFNTFTPLEEGELREQLFSLAEDTSFPVKEIFVMDGSRRSRHSNAYFTGLGKNRRIVLFDTLIESLTNTELAAVLAHEIGHHRRRHIPKSLTLSLLLLLLSLRGMAWITDVHNLYLAFGFTAPSTYATLVVFLFLSSPIFFLLKPGFSLLSRKHEYEADAYAAKVTGTSAHLSSALLSLCRENLTNLRPHPWYSFFHYSHPSVGERIEALQKIEER
jgi:STE24 endopeptidase